jgi:monovalent cation:proton antiporter-2 (CPA2) family protein
MTLLLQLLIILIATKLAGALSTRLGQPAVLGKLLVGILLGPALFDIIQKTDVLSQISEIGVLLLMFIAGLETDLKTLNDNRYSSVAVALGGILFPFVGGYLFGQLFGFDFFEAIFLGLLLSATSVSITVQSLRELGQMKSKESSTILGAALVDDVLVVICLAVMLSFISTEEILLSWVIGKKIIFFVLIGLMSWKVVPWIMDKLAPLRVSEAVISAGLIVCFAFSYIAEYLGVAGIIGAFAAGIAISQTKYKNDVEHKIEPIAYGIFVPVFFVSIGLSVSWQGLGNQLWFVIGLSFIAIFTKLIGAGLGARLTGFNNYSSLAIGAGMISRGEVALIIALIGLQKNLLTQEYFTSIIIVVIASTLVTPPLLKMIFSYIKSKEKLTEQVKEKQMI